MRELEDIVTKEKRQISELEHKYSLTLHQLDLATSREEQLRNESRELERNLALIKHELKEVSLSSIAATRFADRWYWRTFSIVINVPLVFQTQRRSENDAENRKKLEQSIGDLKRKLEEEQNRRTRDHNNSQAVAEKIANLEKLVRHHRNIEIESLQPTDCCCCWTTVDGSERQVEARGRRSQQTEEAERRTVARSRRKGARPGRAAREGGHSAESPWHAGSGIGGSSGNPQSNAVDYLMFWRFQHVGICRLKAQVDRERASRHQETDRQQEMENRRQVLVNELERTKERQVTNMAENKRLSDRIVEMEKKSASLELELKAMTSKYQQEVRAHQQTEESRSGNREEASVEVVKALQLKLQEEKAAKLRAENQWQERERQISMLSVDYRQIQQQLHKLEGDHRQVFTPTMMMIMMMIMKPIHWLTLLQEVDKTKGLVLQLEQESQKRCLLQNDQSALSAELVGLRSRERQLQRELEAAREVARSLEEELHKLRTTKSIDDMQTRELQDQLEAEQYFSTLYKTQVTELREEADEKTKQVITTTTTTTWSINWKRIDSI